MMSQKILIVVSGVDRVPLKNGKYYQTGFWLNELIQPVKHLLANGYELDFTSPGGKKPSIDPNSLKMLPDNVREDYIRVAQSLPGARACARR
jgi:putative intracellular protease/amidase